MPSLGSYLKPWRRAAPRGGGGASEEWEELGRDDPSDREDAEEADAVVVGAAAVAAAPPAKAPPKTEPDGEEAAESSDDDVQPFALLRLRIRPASAAFWVRRRLLGASAAAARGPGALAPPRVVHEYGVLATRGNASSMWHCARARRCSLLVRRPCRLDAAAPRPPGCCLAAQGQWWATCVLLVTSGMFGGIVARVEASPAGRLASSGV